MRPVRRTRYARAHDLDSWKVDERIAPRGFVHHWDSLVADGNGEDLFLDLVDAHLQPESRVLDLGCGHGEFTISVARRAASAVGIERDAGYLELAEELLVESGLTNVRFIRAALAGPGEPHRGGPIPLGEDSVDLVVDRRGPTLERFADDLLRVARPGTVIIGMHPAGSASAPAWARDLPSLQDRFASLPFDQVEAWVTAPLSRLGVDDYRIWWVDVPEYLQSPRAVYDRLAWSPTPGPDVLAWDDVASEVTAAFDSHQRQGALVLRHVRLVWTVRLA